jgi:hypothetical protein
MISKEERLQYGEILREQVVCLSIVDARKGTAEAVGRPREEGCTANAPTITSAVLPTTASDLPTIATSTAGSTTSTSIYTAPGTALQGKLL